MHLSLSLHGENLSHNSKMKTVDTRKKPTAKPDIVPENTVSPEIVRQDKKTWGLLPSNVMRGKSFDVPDANNYDDVVQRRKNSVKRGDENAIRPKKSPNKTGLPNHLKAGIESLSGYSMDDVRVTYNSKLPSQYQAHAITQGNNIHIAPGQEKYLRHESWHVVQQMQGRVTPTTQLKSIKINEDEGLEKEADKMGDTAIRINNMHGTRALQVSTSNKKQEDKEVKQRNISVGVVMQRARIVEKAGPHDYKHWEVQYGGPLDPTGIVPAGQVGVLAMSAVNRANAWQESSCSIITGKAGVRVLNRHLGGYAQVGDLNDPTIDFLMSNLALRIRGQKVSTFDQISNNCQDISTVLWRLCNGRPDPGMWRKRGRLAKGIGIPENSIHTVTGLYRSKAITVPDRRANTGEQRLRDAWQMYGLKMRPLTAWL